MLRKALFWTHLAAGLIAGSVVLIMSATGVALMYERQILGWLERGPAREKIAAAGERRSIETAAAERKATAVTIRAASDEPVELTLAKSAQFVDPYTGVELEAGSPGPRKTFRAIMAWHRWLGVEGEGRATAKAITGACNLAFLGLVISGAILWWPKQLTWRHVRPIVWFKGGLGAKARDFNWHNTIGFWLAIPLFFVVLTAAPISYRWAGDLIYRATGTAPAPAPPPAPAAKGPADWSGLDRALAAARAEVPDWTSLSVRGVPAGSAFTVAVDRGEGGQPQKRSTMTVSRDGQIEKWDRFEDWNLGRRLRSWSRFTHTGEAFGIAGQTIAGLASLGGVFLVYTGVALSLRRFAAWRKRNSIAFGGSGREKAPGGDALSNGAPIGAKHR
jgi:uncharacterized iron-regulated membrane protein